MAFAPHQSLLFVDSQEKSLQVKVEQDLIILQIMIWSPQWSSHLPKFTQLVGTEPEAPPPGFQWLALLCLQWLLGKSAGCIHLHSFAQCLCSTYYESGSVLKPMDRKMKSNSPYLEESFFSELRPRESQVSYTLDPRSLRPVAASSE